MDGTHTVTSHPKHREANDGITWSSHCKQNTLGPILPFPALDMMLDMPRALLGQVLKIPAQNQQGKDSKHGVGGWGLCTDWDLDKVLPGTRFCPSWEALGQPRRKVPRCRVRPA